MTVFAGKVVWTPDRPLHDGVVETDEVGRIVAVRPRSDGDPASLDGMIIPGLVNAHTHLELTGSEPVGGGRGLANWVRAVLATPRPDRIIAVEDGLRRLVACGVAAVSDVGNGPDLGRQIAAAGLCGVYQRELIGHDPVRAAAALLSLQVTTHDGPGGCVISRPAPHALYSTDAEVVQRALTVSCRRPASIHLAESAEELDFAARGAGSLAVLLDDLGVDWRSFSPSQGTPVEALGSALGPGVLLVHGVALTPEDQRAIASHGAFLCLCPRSNAHIGGILPPVPDLLRRGVQLCLGTDSAMSVRDLDVLAEVAVLLRAFPEVLPRTWLDLATEGGARALGLQNRGRIEVGGSPGLLLLEGISDPVELVTPPERRWLIRPGGES